MSEDEKVDLIPVYGVISAAFITENGSCFKDLVFSVFGELAALSQLIRTKTGSIFIIKLKECDDEPSCASVNIVIDGCLASHKELSSLLHTEIQLDNVTATSVKYKGGASPCLVPKPPSKLVWRVCERNLIKYIKHEDFLAELSISKVEGLRHNPVSSASEEGSCKRDIISYQGTVTKVLDLDGGIYELDGKVTLYLTYLFLQSKYIRLKCGVNIVLHNVHAVRTSANINLVCCGLSFVNVSNIVQDDTSCLETPVAGNVFRNIQRFGLHFSEVEWLLTSVRCLTRNLCPIYIPSAWLQESNSDQNRFKVDIEKTIFSDLFPPLVFGKTAGDDVHLHSLLRDFCSSPHTCTFLPKPCSFSPCMRYLSLMELKQYAIDKATADFGNSTSNWKHFALSNTDTYPKMIIVGLLTGSTKNAKLSLWDNSGMLECIVTSPSNRQSNHSDMLKPSDIDHVIKVSEYDVIVERFQIGAAVGLASAQIHHKVYILIHLKDIILLRKLNTKIRDMKPPAEFDDMTCLAQQMSAITVDQTPDPLTVQRLNKNIDELHPTSQHSTSLDQASSLIFCCSRKTPVWFNFKKGFTFEIQATIIDPPNFLSEHVVVHKHFGKADTNTALSNNEDLKKDERPQHAEGPKVVQHIQMIFSGPAVKFFHVLHEGCTYKASAFLSTASVIPHVINITHFNGLKRLDSISNIKSPSDSDGDLDDKILSVEEAVSKNSLKELISLFGIVAKREQLSFQKGVDEAQPIFFVDDFIMGIGTWQNEVIQLEIRDSVNEIVSTRVFLDVANSLYPIGLLDGALVKLTALDGRVSRSNNVYFRSTVATLVEILSHSSSSWTRNICGVSLLTEYMASERLLLSENLVKWENCNFGRFVCLVDIQHIWSVEMQLACAGCNEIITDGNTCSNFACFTSAPSVDKTTLSFLASDGSACVSVRCQGDNARQILQMRMDDWRTLLTSSGTNKTWKNDINKNTNCLLNDVSSRILQSATTRASVYRTLLMEFEWRKSKLQPKGKVTSPYLFCTRLEEVATLTAINCYL